GSSFLSLCCLLRLFSFEQALLALFFLQSHLCSLFLRNNFLNHLFHLFRHGVAFLVYKRLRLHHPFRSRPRRLISTSRCLRGQLCSSSWVDRCRSTWCSSEIRIKPSPLFGHGG